MTVFYNDCNRVIAEACIKSNYKKYLYKKRLKKKLKHYHLRNKQIISKIRVSCKLHFFSVFNHFLRKLREIPQITSIKYRLCQMFNLQRGHLKHLKDILFYQSTRINKYMYVLHSC